MLLGCLLGYLVFLNCFQDLKNILHNYYVTLFEVKHVKVNSYFDQLYDFFIFCYQKHWLLIELIALLLAVVIRKYVKVYKPHAAYALLIANYCLSTFFYGGNSVLLYNDFVAASIFIINVILFIYLFHEWMFICKPWITQWLDLKMLWLVAVMWFEPLNPSPPENSSDNFPNGTKTSGVVDYGW